MTTESLISPTCPHPEPEEPSPPHPVLLTYLRTYSMQQIPSWEAKRFSASQKIPRILCNPKVHYCIHTFPPPVPILSQLDPIHAPTSHFLKIRLNIILPSMPGSSKWPLCLRFPHQNPVYTSPLPHMCYMPRPSNSSRFHHTNNIGWGVQIIKLLIMYFSPLPCYFVVLKSKYSPQHPIFVYPQPMFLPKCERPSFTPIQKKPLRMHFIIVPHMFRSLRNTQTVRE